MDSKLVPHEKFAAFLGRVVHAAAQHGGAVFVGRGAQFLLPREKALAVRIVAPEKCRVRGSWRSGISRPPRPGGGCSKPTAAAASSWPSTSTTTSESPHLYDLVLNTERLEIAGAAALILTALGQKMPFVGQVANLPR